MDLIKALNKEQLEKEVPQVQVGDTVRVHVKVKEGARERIQVFEGTVIAKKHGGIEETFTVRRISYGVGVEKVFPVHSPSIATIEVVRHGFVRRAKLYYLRDRAVCPGVQEQLLAGGRGHPGREPAEGASVRPAHPHREMDPRRHPAPGGAITFI